MAMAGFKLWGRVRHIFSAEKRYVDRLYGRVLTDTASIPTDSIETLFQFGQQSRKELKELVETFPAHEWDATKELKFPNAVGTATPRKTLSISCCMKSVTGRRLPPCSA